MHLINTLRAFARDEAGTVSVEMVLWMSFLIPAATVFGQQVVTPLIENAQAQAALNEDSLRLIQQAMSVCGGGV